MASLFQRLIGKNLPEGGAADEARIPVHVFCALIHEYQRGKVTAQELIAALSLSGEQASDAQTFVGLLNTAPKPVEFMRVFKDWLYLGEVALDATYTSGSALLSRLQEEVTDQGGAPEVIQDGITSAIVVPADWSAEAAEELRAYDEENPPRKPKPVRNVEIHDPVPGLIGYVLTICLVAGMAGYSWFSKDWRKPSLEFSTTFPSR